MSGQLADEVYRRDIKPGFARDVLVVFALHANHGGAEARPSIATVAAKVGCHEATVYRHLRRWKTAGVLSVIAKPRRREDGRSLPTVYAVDLSPLPWKDQPRTHDARYGGDLPRNEGGPTSQIGGGTSHGRAWKNEERPLERPLEQADVSKGETKELSDEEARAYLHERFGRRFRKR